MELLNNKPLLELLSPYADKTLSEGCIISKNKITKGCGNKNHGLTYDCKYIPSNCWVEKTKKIYYKLGCKTNFTKHKILKKKKPGTTYGISIEGKIFDNNNGYYTGIFFEKKEDFKIYHNQLKQLSEGKGLEELYYTRGSLIDEIIGHIGITTVLEYINDKSFGDLKENKCINIVGDNLCCYLSGIDIYIPNKELHLYTKQELEELYNLLKELG